MLRNDTPFHKEDDTLLGRTDFTYNGLETKRSINNLTNLLNQKNYTLFDTIVMLFFLRKKFL